MTTKPARGWPTLFTIFLLRGAIRCLRRACSLLAHCDSGRLRYDRGHFRLTTFDDIVDNIERLKRGKPLRNVVAVGERREA